ncbi:alpha/beta hydrolase [Variovorax sp. LT1R16]|uniref:alpha/beta hydrolase n=1 Tax=Variovorax sp. LT1R16 TaxID=3443728 RepID=UPI003F48F012
MQTKIDFDSAGRRLSGVLHVPDGLAPSERRPALIVIHGFGGNKDGPTHIGEARLYESLGYVALRFDMRGCGDSEGIRGHILCEDQVVDAQAAIDYLSAHPAVRADAIAVSGQSFGGAISMYVGAVDARVAAVISIGGWAHGERKLELQHSGGGGWERFLAMLQRGREYQAETGQSMRVMRWDIVPVPEALRPLLPPGCIMDFPVDTAQSIFDFKPEDVVERIAPRPFLICHGADDSVTPTTEAISIYERTRSFAELAILKGDHFPFADGDPLYPGLLTGWLKRNLPLATDPANAADTH